MLPSLYISALCNQHLQTEINVGLQSLQKMVLLSKSFYNEANLSGYKSLNSMKSRNTFQSKVTFLSFLLVSSLIILQNSGPLIGTAKWQGAYVLHMTLEGLSFSHIWSTHLGIFKALHKISTDLSHPWQLCGLECSNYSNIPVHLASYSAPGQYRLHRGLALGDWQILILHHIPQTSVKQVKSLDWSLLTRM